MGYANRIRENILDVKERKLLPLYEELKSADCGVCGRPGGSCMHDATFFLKRTQRTKSLGKVFHFVMVFAILLSLPLNILLCNRNLTRHTLLVAEKGSLMQ